MLVKALIFIIGYFIGMFTAFFAVAIGSISRREEDREERMLREMREEIENEEKEEQGN